MSAFTDAAPYASPVVSGLAAWVVAKVAQASSARKTALRVDGQAYDRAQQINRDIVDDLEHQIERLEKRADAAEQRAEAAERRSQAAEERAAACAREVVSLRRTIREMAREMQQRGMQPPPEAIQE